jgi:hypothetical protein
MTAGDKPVPRTTTGARSEREGPPQVCPRCGSNQIVAIAYGYPGPELMSAAERREVLLGGCVLWEAMASDGCAGCGWPVTGSDPFAPEDPAEVS